MIKNQNDLTKYEIATVASISGSNIIFTSDLGTSYPIGSFIYIIKGERDFFDSTVSDRTETNVQFFDEEERQVD